uniref:Late nodulin-like protein n=1 Tax=Astragalus sinicus TaxID=47065 RepID=Q07A37_ASTSI|nr:late nodulin-like protein [Astragalus sinicus]
MPLLLKFVYVMVLFLSLFFISTNVDGADECITDSDCPQDNFGFAGYGTICVDKTCMLSKIKDP